MAAVSKAVAPYGTWPSPISAELASAAATGFSALTSAADNCCYLASLPSEGGRSSLFLLPATPGGTPIELTPAPLNVRSRVHEYGGGAYTLGAGHAYVVNHQDQNIYQVPCQGDAAPMAITHSDDQERFADLQYVAAGYLLAVRERHGLAGQAEPVNDLVAIRISDGEIQVLHQGHDFYAAPRLCPAQQKLCFLTWDHPNLPWDGTQLQLATLQLDTKPHLDALTLVAGGVDEAICQPCWLADGRLLFVSDAEGWWNLYCLDTSGVFLVHQDQAEYGLPLWMFGQQSYVPLNADLIAAQRIENGAATLVLISITQGFRTPLASDWQEFDHLCCWRNQLLFIGQHCQRPNAIVSVEVATGREQRWVDARPLPLPAGCLATPMPLRFASSDGQHAHAWFYPPTHADLQGPADQPPPLLVMTHGGPTAAARRALNFRVQYYTSRGWAVADLNYRGSTGFGRAYRELLRGNWGVADVADAEALVEYLATTQHTALRIDPNRVAIRGGSAGGYTTLCALTFGNSFKAGASHYGIGDLETLARDTHKFEARYLDSLVGPYPAARSRYQERSPLHYVAQLSCPVIFLQGLLDKVVPPNQADAMVAALRSKGLPVSYVQFADEAHGFRNPANAATALAAEHSFFCQVFALAAPDLLPLEIENL